MRKLKSWELGDEFWERAKELIPERKREKEREYKRKIGGGRKGLCKRKVLSGILYVLRTGIQWKALPKEKFGSASSVHKYFQEWVDSDFFLSLWKAGLAEYDEMEGIKWEWQSADGAMNKSPMGKESVGKNPTDRGKKWGKKKSPSRRNWSPTLDRRIRSERT